MGVSTVQLSWWLEHDMKAACRRFHDAKYLGRLDLSEIALQAARAGDPAYPASRRGRGRALQEVLSTCLAKLKTDDYSTPEGEMYWCLFLRMYGRDPYHDGVRIQSAVAYVEANAPHIRYPRRLRQGIEALTYQVCLYLSPYDKKLLNCVKIIEEAAPVPPALVSPQELKVLMVAATGRTMTKEIAADMGLSTNTVNTYWTRILRKFGVNKRAQAIRHAFRLGLIQ